MYNSSVGMNDWKSKLKADPVPWLLQEDNPSVRYLTIVDILGRSSSNSEALEAKKTIMTQGLTAIRLPVDVPDRHPQSQK